MEIFSISTCKLLLLEIWNFTETKASENKEVINKKSVFFRIF